MSLSRTYKGNLGRFANWPGHDRAWRLLVADAPAIYAVVILFLSCGTGFTQAWQQRAGYRFTPLPVREGTKAGFKLLDPKETGIWFTNVLPESRSLTNTLLPNGSGVAAGDIDADGRCDLFFSGLGGGSRLYRNLGGWRFEDVTGNSGLTLSNLDATGALFADLDGDNHLDLIVNSIGGGTRIFMNDGRGHFTQADPVLNAGRGGTSLAMADAEGHGTLDLYVANYRAATILDAPGTRFTMRMVNNHPEVALINGRPVTDPEWTNRFAFKTAMDAQGRGRLAREELGEPDVFFRNKGHGHFESVSWTGGSFLDEQGRALSSPPFDWGLSIMFRDFNGDGIPDLYICNDFSSPDRFWLSDGHGHFQAAPREALRETSFSSMGIDVADLNRDGHDDFLVVDMLSREHVRRLTQRNSAHSEMASLNTSSDRPQYTRNTLFLSRGDGTYAEAAQYAGLEATEWSWAPLFIDVDLDGYEDLLVPNGFVRDNMNLDVQNRIKQAGSRQRTPSAELLNLRKWFAPLVTANLAFRNQGELRFADFSTEWGFNAAMISQGACLADLDNDGDLDVILNNLNEVAGIYRNDASAPRLAVRLKGAAPNTRGIGARIVVKGGPVQQSQVMVCGGRYLSADDAERVFAAGGLTNRLQVEVTWRSGKRSTVTGAQPNCLYEIDESGAEAVASPPTRTPTPAFEDASQRLGHVHHEEPFDDFQRQPLLPKRLSQLGPGACWWDIDGDGRDDLIIGSGKGGRSACYHNEGDGKFSRVTQGTWTNLTARDQTAIVGWQGGNLLIGSANYEDGLTNGSSVQAWEPGQNTVRELISAGEGSVGALAVADYENTGLPGFFVGTRVKAGKYPLPGDSFLYHQRGGKIVLDETNSAVLRALGLVTGAVWSDLDGDGFPELMVACEWGPLHIFRNEQGRLIPWDAPLTFGLVSGERPRNSTLSQLKGWWNGITVGDFDGDGRMDIVAANWGRNSKYERHRDRPLRLYYGDFARDGNLSLFESYYDATRGRYVPACGLESAEKEMPSLASRYATHQAWGETDMDTVLQDTTNGAHYWEATWLETTVLLNRGDHFEARLLPMEAQLAPAFAVCVADYDGDGAEDIFLGQNFFDVDSTTSRYDAGRGLWLKGDGHGGFGAVPGQESGVRVYGEQRGAAVCDYDGDGRIDLVLTQNQGETKLFHNVTATPGLRVVLAGPPGNPHGIGAVMRLKFGDHLGPAREIHGGSGYWSQDSVVQVMSMNSPASGLWVRWPGGKTVEYELPSAARQIAAGIDGSIRDLEKASH